MARSDVSAGHKFPGFLRRLGDWLWQDNVRAYELEKEQNADDVIVRFARGNVLFQNGAILDEEGFRDLVVRGDVAAAELKRYAHRK